MAKKPEPSWRILAIRGKRADSLGTVTAPNAEAAINRACEDFGITDPERRRRLVAQPVVKLGHRSPGS
jgi:hypothetical protein